MPDEDDDAAQQEPGAGKALPSPERLDRLIEIVQPNTWVALTTAAILVGAAIVWSIVGRLPVVVSGRGVVVPPRTVVAFQATAPGRLETLRVKKGDLVHKGDVLATIEQPDIVSQLEAEKARLQRLSAQDRDKDVLQGRRTFTESGEINAERQVLAVEREHDVAKKAEAEALSQLLKQRVDILAREQAEGLLPRVSNELVLARQSYLENESRITDLEGHVHELDARSKTLESRDRTLARQNLDDTSTRRNEIEDATSRIAMLQVQLATTGAVVSSETGRILEMTVNPGQVVTLGQRLGSIELEDAGLGRVVIAYFPVGDGKKIAPGMTIQLTPDSIARERFGGMLGTVTATSAFPVTRDSVVTTIGNPELADALLQPGPQIELTAELIRDPATVSGYRWSSSKGPPLRISTGMTVSARVTVEGRAPITYVLPFLRSASGIY